MAVNFAHFLKKIYLFSFFLPHPFLTSRQSKYIFRYIVTTEGFRLLWQAISIVMAWVCFFSAAQDWLITQTVPSTKFLNNHKAESSVSERANFPSVRHIARFSSLSTHFLSAFHLRLITSSALPSVMRHFACGNRGLHFSITGLIDKQSWIYVGSARLCGGSRERENTPQGFLKYIFSHYMH